MVVGGLTQKSISYSSPVPNTPPLDGKKELGPVRFFYVLESRRGNYKRLRTVLMCSDSLSCVGVDGLTKTHTHGHFSCSNNLPRGLGQKIGPPGFIFLKLDPPAHLYHTNYHSL